MKPDLPRGLYRAVFFLAPCIGLIGLTLEVPALSVLAGGMLGLIMLAALYVIVVGGRLSLGRRCADGACQDDSVPVTLAAVNRGFLPVHLLEVGDEFEPALNPAVRLVVPSMLWPGYQHAFEYSGHCFRRRGIYHVGPLSLQVRDPMGFFVRREAVADIRQFDVFPNIVPLPTVQFPKGRPGASCATQSYPRAGASLAYLGTREYRPGDEVRDIHWPATARLGRPVVKEREVDLPPMVTLVLDLDERHFEGVGQRSTVEFQVTVAASLALEATRQRGAFQVIADDLHLPVGAGPMQLEAFMHKLVTLKPDSNRAIGDVLREAARHVPPDSLVVPFIAGLELHPGLLSAGVQACVAQGCAVRCVVFDDSTFLRRKRRVPAPGDTRLSVETIVRWLNAAGAEACVMGAEDDPSARILEIFEGIFR